MRSTTTYEKSIFSSIVKLVENAETEKPEAVRLADHYSIYFTIFTFVLAYFAYLKSPELAAAVLVVATPCPLILAAPIAFISGMNRSARHGIIVKHGSVFETLLRVKVFCFDKTGTLTLGVPSVSKVQSFSTAYNENDIIKFAASLELASQHVLARSIVEKAESEGISLVTPTKTEELFGKGIIGTIEGKVFTVCGNTYLEELAIIPPLEKNKNSRTSIYAYVLLDGEIIGSIRFSDTVRSNAKDILKKLKSFKKDLHITLLTGDKDDRAEEVGRLLGIKDVKGNCLPQDKQAFVKSYEERDMPVAMVGDGVNDAPSLAAASLSIALGSHGATASTDIADVVIVADDLGKLERLFAISIKTVRVAKQSMLVGIGLSIVAMGAAYAGFLPPVTGAILQEGIDVLVIFNALRAL
jgi:heavy metal translocating P-type ATPase